MNLTDLNLTAPFLDQANYITSLEKVINYCNDINNSYENALIIITLGFILRILLKVFKKDSLILSLIHI